MGDSLHSQHSGIYVLPALRSYFTWHFMLVSHRAQFDFRYRTVHLYTRHRSPTSPVGRHLVSLRHSFTHPRSLSLRSRDTVTRGHGSPRFCSACSAESTLHPILQMIGSGRDMHVERVLHRVGCTHHHAATLSGHAGRRRLILPWQIDTIHVLESTEGLTLPGCVDCQIL